jgi:hypothetical protein
MPNFLFGRLGGPMVWIGPGFSEIADGHCWSIDEDGFFAIEAALNPHLERAISHYGPNSFDRGRWSVALSNALAASEMKAVNGLVELSLISKSWPATFPAVFIDGV